MLDHTRTHKTRTVSIVYRFLPQYRQEFFSELKCGLEKDGIELNLLYGKNRLLKREDEIDIEWAIPIQNRLFRLGKHVIYLQPIPKVVFDSDLIILMQENTILSNYLVMLRSIFGGPKVALWGHGLNLQARPDSLGNRFKTLYSCRVHWWFAYTKGSAKLVANMGFPEKRITVVENAIDTKSLSKEAEAVTIKKIYDLKLQIGVEQGPIGLYCGGMYKEKRLEYLLEACNKIRGSILTFEVLFIGYGPDSQIIKNFCVLNKWAHYLGPLFGAERIPFFKMSDVFLMPGAVGLAVLDCFALETPMVTTKFQFHGPELGYLISGENGVITEDTVGSFVEGVLSVLDNATLKAKLKLGCRRAAQKYTIENMVHNFVGGVKQALS